MSVRTPAVFGLGQGDKSGVRSVDVSSPSSPFLSANWDSIGFAGGLELVGSIGLVAADTFGVQVLDFAIGPEPAFLGRVDTPGAARDVAVLTGWNRAYVADGVSGLVVLDITNPASPGIVASLDTPDFADRVAVSPADDLIFVADRRGGLHVFLEGGGGTSLVGSLGAFDEVMSVTAVGGTSYVLVADGSAGMHVVDVATPDNPTILSTVAIPGFATDIAVAPTAPDIAYLTAGSTGLHLFDISIPVSPIIIGSIVTPGHASSVAASGTTAYVAAQHAGLRIVDASDPTNPVSLGSFDTAGAANHVTLVGSVAHISDSVGDLIDVSVTTALEGAVDIGPDFGGFSEFSITAVSGQVDPYEFDGDSVGVSLVELEIGGTGSIDWNTGMVSVALGLRVSAFGYLDVVAAASAWGLLDADTDVVTLYPGARACELVLDPAGVSMDPKPAIVRSFSATPNPFAGEVSLKYELRQAGIVTVRVHDVSGRLVESLELGQTPAGLNQYNWSAKPVTRSGVYFISLTVNGHRTTSRLIKLN